MRTVENNRTVFTFVRINNLRTIWIFLNYSFWYLGQFSLKKKKKNWAGSYNSLRKLELLVLTKMWELPNIGWTSIPVLYHILSCMYFILYVDQKWSISIKYMDEKWSTSTTREGYGCRRLWLSLRPLVIETSFGILPPWLFLVTQWSLASYLVHSGIGTTGISSPAGVLYFKMPAQQWRKKALPITLKTLE